MQNTGGGGCPRRPPQIVRNATIVRTVNGAMQTLKKGTNDFTCMENNCTPMGMDPNAMEWAHAWQTHAPPPDKIGFIYMLNGDTGDEQHRSLGHQIRARQS